MSTGKRLAKRSIIGTRVCAPGPDGLWYSGIIQDVKTPQTNLVQENNNCINLTPDTKYSVRFDFKTQLSSTSSAATTAGGVSGATMITDMNTNNGNNGGLNAAAASAAAIASNFVSPAMSVRRNAMIKEFRENELIGPGFRSIIGIQLHPGQRVFLTHNGREISGDVISHDLTKDEVVIKVTPIGYEEPLELKKRLEEVRLLESRRSARLADQDRDTDFARLADMAGDRRRASHSIDVPLALTQHNSRKRRPSYSQDERDNYLPQFRDDDQMDACNAALVLMSLSCSPHSPRTGQWNANLGSSPGSSSAASWSSSGSSSPPLSDDGNTSNYVDNTAARIRTTSLSTSDEGIVMDYSDEAPRKRRAHGPIFQCTWKGCGIIETTVQKIELHVRNAHLGPKKPRHSFDDDGAFSDSDHEEEFYYTEIEDEGKAPSPPSPPTLSHRDMARPPHEDPEYQRQIVGNFRQGLLALSQSTSFKSSAPAHASAINIPTSPLAHHNYTWAQQSPVSPHKHARWSPRPSTSSAPYPSPTYVNHYNNQHSNMQQNMAITQGGNQQHHHHQAAAISNLSHSAPAASSLLANSNSTLHHHHHNQQHQHPNHQQQPNGNNNNNNSLGVHPPHQIQQQHHHHQSPTPQHLQSPIAQTNRSPQSPNRRTRGENKKCRKVYGMDHKDQWCTQCKWKKACSRFGD